ncbi:UNVERIFIED_CONTAM: protein OSB1, mitochondrial [Sesamum latifolium]|uniref:Protein OSB1, mitochondrial n=1 Tax=Sesamum latifolium TaxID=2727402 RepID=A0AAW2WAL8_9LAMI
MQKRRNRLHLWQIFFANPYEWWDDRNCKLSPKAPDFKHKDTGEVLWLKDNDPPWIKRQLQLIDSRLSKRSPGERRNACCSNLEYSVAVGSGNPIWDEKTVAEFQMLVWPESN